MADNTPKWRDATRQIHSALDLAAEYRLLGLRVADKKPNAKGWIDAHAWGVEDNTPSAGINVGDGPLQGRYKDFRSGESCTLFDFAATRAGRFGGDWKEARNHYARQTGVKLPAAAEELTADRFDFYDLTFGVMSVFAQGKPGVTVRAIQECGGKGARWPKKLSAEKTNHLIAFPMYGSALLDLEPVAWHCCPANPTSKIRQFRGVGNEDKLLDKMTVGEPQLMNVDALNRLPTADVVNVAEGITDLLAGQAVLTVWRDEDPDNRQHVILSAGACSYHPKPEWMHHFAGKEIRIWFDVGDENNAGQVGAAVWVRACLPVAKAVRNVKLPLGKNGGKNDLRAWLTGADGSGQSRTYAEMDAYAQTFEPIEVADAEAQLSEHEALLKGLGLVIIGEHEGSQRIEVFSENTKKSATIGDIDRLSVPKLIQLTGPEAVEEHIYEGKDQGAPGAVGKKQLKDVHKAISAAASGKTFHPDEHFGAGVWEIDGHLLLVKSKEAAILNGGGKVTRSHVPFFNGRFLDLGSQSKDWFDAGTIDRYLAEAHRSDEFCQQAFAEAEQLFAKWFWRHQKPTPRVVAGLVICSWLQSVWPWRPEVFITGDSNTGKSSLIEDVIKTMFGELAFHVQKPTEASIRQIMRHNGQILLIDEFEHDNHRQKVLELCRVSSRGGYVTRGTADQKGMRYRLRHLPWLAAIETGLRKQADRNRFIMLELQEIPAEAYGKIQFPSESQLEDLGMRLLAAGLRHCAEAKRIAQVLRETQFLGVPGRVVQSFAVPMAMFAAIYRLSDAEAVGFMQITFADWDFGMQSTSDNEELLQEIMSVKVQIEGTYRKTATVTRALAMRQEPDVVAALQQVGIRKVVKRNGREVLFITNSITKHLRDGQFSGHVIENYLMRLVGAKRVQQRMGGHERMKGIEIPFETIDATFNFGATDDADGGNIEDGTTEGF